MTPTLGQLVGVLCEQGAGGSIPRWSTFWQTAG